MKAETVASVAMKNLFHSDTDHIVNNLQLETLDSSLDLARATNWSPRTSTWGKGRIWLANRIRPDLAPSTQCTAEKGQKMLRIPLLEGLS